MELKEYIKQAVEVKKKYHALERKKYGKEWTREQQMQGFVVDMGELMELVMAKEGIREVENVDEKLRHELADCLWSIFILADKYEVDLEKAFQELLEKLNQKIGKESEE